MKSRLINVFAAIYICFAILAAHSSLVADQAATASCADHQACVVTSSGVVLDNQRLPATYEDSYWDIIIPVKPIKPTKDDYTIVLWTSEYCSACVKYKKNELPALRELGYRVIIKDYHEDVEERPEEVNTLPTLQLNYKGKPVKFEVYWKARDIDDFITGSIKWKLSHWPLSCVLPLLHLVILIG